MRRDFSEIRGQDAVVRAVANAVHDRTPILLSGPPGTGKTMIASRIPGLLPDITDHEERWIRAEYEVIRDGAARWDRTVDRPFRAPHHTISSAALSSGRMMRELRAPEAACRCKQLVSEKCPWHTLPKAVVPPAGEARLARFGVLFLDELPEFRREAIGALADTLRDMGEYRPYLVASANACPCGFRGLNVRDCTCTQAMVARYVERVQWACSQLRIVVRIDVPAISLESLRNGAPGPSTQQLRKGVTP